ncbi:TIGR03089 family protein [Citricoccus sp. GCM10030269]|uniref:TIGR03089 family protein n=1 Tax=Citricoccus sp. GCM10030269 TaxID=3273388 RepID=UPI00361DEBF3
MVSLGTNVPPGGGRPGQWFDAIAASPRPAVVDYAADASRVELSGRVLANWGAKTANLFDLEGHGPGSTVVLNLPLEWKSLALMLGAARAGVGVVFAGRATAADGSGRDTLPEGAMEVAADLVVSASPHDWSAHPAELWAVSTSELATESSDQNAELPSHALDYAAEVQMQADQCPLPLPGTDLRELVAAWRDAESNGAESREPEPDGGTPDSRSSRHERGLVISTAGGALNQAVAGGAAQTWQAGLPVVLVSSELGDAEVARIVAAERLGPERTAVP